MTNRLLVPFTLDTRWIAIGRIGLGLTVFFDFLQALRWRHFYYSDMGVLPRAVFAQINGLEYHWSLYFLLGAPWFTTVLLLLSAICAAFWTAGWKTKYTTPLLWLAVVALQGRNPWVSIGGDIWLRATLFWLIFLPCGEHYVLQRQGEKRSGPRSVANAASMGLILQAVYIYLWAGALKYGGAYQEGTSLYYILSSLEFGSRRSQWLLYYPDLLRVVSLSIPYLEITAAICLISPFRTTFFRRVGVAVLLCMHLGIWYCMELYHFSPIAVATLLLLWLPNNPAGRSSGHLSRGLSGVLLVWTFLLLVYNPIRLSFPEHMSRSTLARANLLGLEQNWALFAPSPPTSTYLLYAVAVLDDGSVQPLGLRGEKRAKPPYYDDPAAHVRLFRYWKSIFELGTERRGPAFSSYASWYARRWHFLYPEERDRLKSIKLYYQEYPIEPGYQDSPPRAPVEVIEYQLP